MLAWAERVKERLNTGEDLRTDRALARTLSGNSEYGRHAVTMALAWHGVPIEVTTWLIVDSLKVKHWRSTWRRMLWQRIKRWVMR